jgi:hypothetical protein
MSDTYYPEYEVERRLEELAQAEEAFQIIQAIEDSPELQLENMKQKAREDSTTVAMLKAEDKAVERVFRIYDKLRNFAISEERALQLLPSVCLLLTKHN